MFSSSLLNGLLVLFFHSGMTNERVLSVEQSLRFFMTCCIALACDRVCIGLSVFSRLIAFMLSQLTVKWYTGELTFFCTDLSQGEFVVNVLALTPSCPDTLNYWRHSRICATFVPSTSCRSCHQREKHEVKYKCMFIVMFMWHNEHIRILVPTLICQLIAMFSIMEWMKAHFSADIALCCVLSPLSLSLKRHYHYPLNLPASFPPFGLLLACQDIQRSCVGSIMARF